MSIRKEKLCVLILKFVPFLLASYLAIATINCHFKFEDQPKCDGILDGVVKFAYFGVWTGLSVILASIIMWRFIDNFYYDIHKFFFTILLAFFSYLVIFLFIVIWAFLSYDTQCSVISQCAKSYLTFGCLSGIYGIFAWWFLA